MEEFPEVDLSDPMTAIFVLNDEMAKRTARIGYILDYAYWAGAIVAFVSVVTVAGILVVAADLWLLVFPAAALVLSPLFMRYAYRERQFLDEYRMLAGMVSRAKDWDPHPEIPAGEEPLERLIAYLRDEDPRFAYLYGKKPQCLTMPYEVEVPALDLETYSFDAHFECGSWPWYRIKEGLRIFIKVVPVAEFEDVEDLMAAVAEELEDLEEGQMLPTRIILLQTEDPDFGDDVLDYVGENWIEYDLTIGRDEWDWETPIELMAEGEDGHYNIGSVYFG